MTEPQPSLRPTSVATLFVVCLAGAALTWVLVGEYYGELPGLTWLPALTIGLLALAEAYVAWVTRARVQRHPGAEPVDALVVARFAVLAKASSVVGAGFTGVYGALTLWLLTSGHRLTAAAQDVPSALLGFGASVGLLAAAVWLEHACRIPPGPEDKDEIAPPPPLR